MVSCTAGYSLKRHVTLWDTFIYIENKMSSFPWEDIVVGPGSVGHPFSAGDKEDVPSGSNEATQRWSANKKSARVRIRVSGWPGSFKASFEDAIGEYKALALRITSPCARKEARCLQTCKERGEAGNVCSLWLDTMDCRVAPLWHLEYRLKLNWCMS